jgi:hypothetical protein
MSIMDSFDPLQVCPDRLNPDEPGKKFSLFYSLINRVKPFWNFRMKGAGFMKQIPFII